MSAPRQVLGTLCGQPVEFAQSYFHPESPTQHSMVCGSPTRWLQWGRGDWCVMSDRAKLFALRDSWLKLNWSPADAVEIWAEHVQDLSGWSVEEAQQCPTDRREFEALHLRWHEAHRAGARRYAQGIGVLP